MSRGVILLQYSISFTSPLLLILRQEITAAAVALFVYRVHFINMQWYHECNDCFSIFTTHVFTIFGISCRKTVSTILRFKDCESIQANLSVEVYEALKSGK